MCGIFFCYSKNEIDEDKFKSSLLLQKHRGPDFTGIKKINSNLIFGHVRLSILDTSAASNQPMIGENSSCVMIFNGEIYNYVELRKKFENNNFNFKTQGDTEVLFKLLENFGSDSIQSLNGSYAFVFYNSKNNKIIISRDRFGKKPLYYFEDKENLIISSEIKSIFSYLNKKRIIRKSHLDAFIKYNYLPNSNEETLYYEINQFMPGTITEIELGINFFKKKVSYKNCIKNFLDLNSEVDLKELIKDSVKIRLRSDVKTAVLLSGGIDSTAVALNAKEISKDLTFVKGFMGEDEDNFYAKELAKNLKVNLINIDLRENIEKIIERIQNITKHLELPMPITGITLATNILYEKIAEMGIKVVLDGNGGDELYCGYTERYLRFYINSCIENYEFLNLLKFIYFRKDYHVNLKTILKYTIQKIGNKFFNLNFEEKIFDKTKLSLKQNNPFLKKNIFKGLEEYQLWDIEFGPVQKMLKLWDNSVMMNSVEARSPLFDYRQIYNIKKNNKEKFYNGYNKYKLRQTLPEKLAKKIKIRKKKQPLKLDISYNLLKEKNSLIFKDIAESKLINSCLKKEEINFFCDKAKIEKYEKIILRLYSVSTLEKIYDCRAE